MEYLDANRQALRSLQEALQARRVMGLVGAGCSVRAGYPTWSDLLQRMEEAICQREPLLAGIISQLKNEDDVLWRAQEYRRLLADGYGSFLRECFGEEAGRVTGFHKKLVRLPLRHFLTTNYDPILELAHTAVRGEPARWIQWDDSWDLREFIFRSGDPSYSRRYVYLHGRYNKPRSIILTEEDYQKRYVLSDRDADRIAALLATQQVLSIGYSLSDFDVMELFRQVKARTGPGRPHHYALLPLDEGRDPGIFRRRLNGKYGVEPVFYPWTQDHAGLDELLDRLSGSRSRIPPAKPRVKKREPSLASPRPDRAVPVETGTGPQGQQGLSIRELPVPDVEPLSPPKQGFAVSGDEESSTKPAPPAAKKPDQVQAPLRIFVSYSIKDGSFLQRLKEQFNQHAKSGLSLSWTDRPIQTGIQWHQDLFDELERSDLVLLLVSPSFLATDYVYHAEMKRALELQENGQAQVIPIIVQPADWKSAPFAQLQALPRAGKPVTEWEDAGQAWKDIAAGLKAVAAKGL